MSIRHGMEELPQKKKNVDNGGS